VIDFLAVLLGYAISGEHSLETFYARLRPFAGPFMALFGRDQLPARSPRSRFLAALTSEPVEALRTLFLDDLESRPLVPEKQAGGLVDRAGSTWMIFDIDGTREAARQRALPQAEALPAPFRRLDDVCAAFLPGAQARAGRADSHRHQSGPQLKVGSAVLAIEATDATGRNCVRASRPSVGISRRISSRENAPCSGSMANRAPGLCWWTWLASPL